MNIRQRKALQQYNYKHEIKYPPLDNYDTNQEQQAVFLLLGVATAMVFALIVALFLL